MASGCPVQRGPWHLTRYSVTRHSGGEGGLHPTVRLVEDTVSLVRLEGLPGPDTHEQQLAVTCQLVTHCAANGVHPQENHIAIEKGTECDKIP